MTAELVDELADAGLLERSGVEGVYVRSIGFERVVRGVERVATAAGADETHRRLFFPPVMDRSNLVTAGYLEAFPDLVGTVSSFTAGEAALPELIERADGDGDWAALLDPIGIALCPSACQALYPLVARESVPVEGLRFEVHATCFRHEPSTDVARMQTFEMHEFVFVGTAEGAGAHRDGWVERACAVLGSLGLDVQAVEAHDPFFGRRGRLLAAGQLEGKLKSEIIARISGDDPRAIASVNLHQDHFGQVFGIVLDDGRTAHSACVGFGLDRVALALFRAHGVHTSTWDPDVRAALGIPDDDEGPQR